MSSVWCAKKSFRAAEAELRRGTAGLGNGCSKDPDGLAAAGGVTGMIREGWRRRRERGAANTNSQRADKIRTYVPVTSATRIHFCLSFIHGVQHP